MNINDIPFNFDNGNNIFFTSDTHFYHKNMIQLANRPFSSVEEMNETMINNWNNKVNENDIVFHLGDFAFGGTQKWTDIIQRLNGNIHLILGNHDYKNMKNSVIPYFKSVNQQLRIYIEDWTIYLNHFPYLAYGGAYDLDRHVAQAFGHVHSAPNANGKDIQRLQLLFPTQYDVGVDNNNFTPISWNELKNIFLNNIEKAANN